MDSSTLWQQTLQEYQQKGVIAISCEEIDAETRLQTLSEAEPPPPVAAFLQRWRQTSHDSWQALLQNAITVNPGIVKQLTSASFLQPLRALLASAEYAAILCQTHADWREKQQWSYLFQLKSPQDQNIEEASYIVLHIPASPQEIAAAEAVLRLTLPPSYRCFLSITNGLGIGTFSITGIYGAGPTRANWDAVVLNQWSECEKYRHEIAAEWRSFQGVYDYERIMDWERGENSFGSDETILVPFAYTYETWCFDRTRSNENGEYPVMLWDHETREASESYADFPAWFSNEIVPYLFDE